MSAIKKAEFDLIRQDARFIYSLQEINEFDINNSSNYLSMCIPYMGLFTNNVIEYVKLSSFEKPEVIKDKTKIATKTRLGIKSFEDDFEHLGDEWNDSLLYMEAKIKSHTGSRPVFWFLQRGKIS